MNKLLLALVAAPAIALSTSATSITAIYGSGNPAAGWTDDVSGDIQLALRAKNRTTGDASNVNGVYTYATAPATRGLWNYEFSINSDIGDGSTKLTAYDYYLSVDTDPSQGINAVVFNPLAAWGDNSYGDNTTSSGAGSEGSALLYAGSNNLVQNSQNITFAPFSLPLDPNATYSFSLFATESGAGQGGRRLAEVDITVVVGNGGAKVPDGGATAALLGLGLVGMMTLRKKK